MASESKDGLVPSSAAAKKVAAVSTASFSDEGLEHPLDLLFDPVNPRMPLMKFSSEEETIKFMMDSHDVDELVRSILVTGWLDYEPLIVERPTKFVLEGNRRLAALKLIASAALRKAANYNLPAIENAKPLPDRVRVRYVPDRKTARSFIGFKHVNGPVKWDAYAKARFAVEWLEDQGSLSDVSKALGDNHNTVRRLVDGWRVLEQSISWGFSIEQRGAKRFSFSHLYTAVSRPSVRRYLNLTPELSDVLPKMPVPASHRVNLMNLMSWLYGQGSDAPPVLRSQNPDLNKISEVLSSETATAMLVRSRNLDVAYEEVIPKSSRFADALYDAIRSAETAAGLHASYNGDAVHFEAAQNLFLTVRGMRDNMRKTLEGGDD
jgi:hypothetical protein